MMTREEAIAEIERLLECAKKLEGPQTFVDFRPVPALEMALTALRPVSREQVEKMRGEWMFPIFTDQKDANDPRCQCSECGSIETPLARHRFCPSCGRPMTDEAVQMVMERMEALYEET